MRPWNIVGGSSSVSGNCWTKVEAASPGVIDIRFAKSDFGLVKLQILSNGAASTPFYGVTLSVTNGNNNEVEIYDDASLIVSRRHLSLDLEKLLYGIETPLRGLQISFHTPTGVGTIGISNISLMKRGTAVTPALNKISSAGTATNTTAIYTDASLTKYCMEHSFWIGGVIKPVIWVSSGEATTVKVYSIDTGVTQIQVDEIPLLVDEPLMYEVPEGIRGVIIGFSTALRAAFIVGEV